MKDAPHPPYSPDLGPSDFYRFGYLKECLAGLSFQNAGELLESGQGLLDGIEKVSLQTVFPE
jgi:hypothetical protein